MGLVYLDIFSYMNGWFLRVISRYIYLTWMVRVSFREIQHYLPIGPLEIETSSTWLLKQIHQCRPFLWTVSGLSVAIWMRPCLVQLRWPAGKKMLLVITLTTKPGHFSKNQCLGGSGSWDSFCRDGKNRIDIYEVWRGGTLDTCVQKYVL